MELLNYPLDNALSRTIAEKILDQILNGELKPGDKIVESTYADLFQTSRSPVREAIYLLATEGLIERVPRKGAFIRGYSISEIQDLLDVRNNIEILAAKKIIDPQKNKQLLNEMMSILKNMEKSSNQLEYTHLNYAFHFTLIKFSGSTIFEDVYCKIALPLLRIQGIHFNLGETIEKSKREHKAIYELLKENQMDELISLLRKHTEDVIFNVRKTVL
nr:GntR family transcriptional regulator [Lysinibacillus timonensis]